MSTGCRTDADSCKAASCSHTGCAPRQRVGAIGFQVSGQSEQLAVLQQPLERGDFEMGKFVDPGPPAPLHEERSVAQVTLTREGEAMVDQREIGTGRIEENIRPAPVLVADGRCWPPSRRGVLVERRRGGW